MVRRSMLEHKSELINRCPIYFQKLLLLITAIWISNVLKFTNHIRLSLFFFFNYSKRFRTTEAHSYIGCYVRGIKRREKKSPPSWILFRPQGNRRLGDRRVVRVSFTLNLITRPYDIRRNINMHWQPKQ